VRDLRFHIGGNRDGNGIGVKNMTALYGIVKEKDMSAFRILSGIVINGRTRSGHDVEFHFSGTKTEVTRKKNGVEERFIGHCAGALAGAAAYTSGDGWVDKIDNLAEYLLRQEEIDFQEWLSGK